MPFPTYKPADNVGQMSPYMQQAFNLSGVDQNRQASPGPAPGLPAPLIPGDHFSLGGFTGAVPQGRRWEQLRQYLAGLADTPGAIPQGRRWSDLRAFIEQAQASTQTPQGFTGAVPQGPRWGQLRQYLAGAVATPGAVPQGPQWSDLRDYLASQGVGNVAGGAVPESPMWDQMRWMDSRDYLASQGVGNVAGGAVPTSAGGMAFGGNPYL